MRHLLLFLVFVLFACFAAMSISAVLIDHGMIGGIWFDLFAVSGIVFALPTLIIGFAEI